MLAKAFQYAFRGILRAVKHERSMQIILACVVLAVAAGFALRLTRLEWCVVLLCCGGVFSVELINTAVECVVDMIVSEYDARAEKAKDIAAGATLVLVAVSLVAGLIVFVPHILSLFH